MYNTVSLVNNCESEVTQSCPTLCDPVDCSPPGSSIHGILLARILAWVAISFSRGSSRPRDWTQVCLISGRRFNLWATREAQCCIFETYQESRPQLLLLPPPEEGWICEKKEKKTREGGRKKVSLPLRETDFDLLFEGQIWRGIKSTFLVARGWSDEDESSRGGVDISIQKSKTVYPPRSFIGSKAF